MCQRICVGVCVFGFCSSSSSQHRHHSRWSDGSAISRSKINTIHEHALWYVINIKYEFPRNCRVAFVENHMTFSVGQSTGQLVHWRHWHYSTIDSQINHHKYNVVRFVHIASKSTRNDDGHQVTITISLTTHTHSVAAWAIFHYDRAHLVMLWFHYGEHFYLSITLAFWYTQQNDCRLMQAFCSAETPYLHNRIYICRWFFWRHLLSHSLSLISHTSGFFTFGAFFLLLSEHQSSTFPYDAVYNMPLVTLIWSRDIFQYFHFLCRSLSSSSLCHAVIFIAVHHLWLSMSHLRVVSFQHCLSLVLFLFFVILKK